MNTIGIISAAALIGGVGIFVGLFLGVAAIAFKVKVDEKEEAVLVFGSLSYLGEVIRLENVL